MYGKEIKQMIKTKKKNNEVKIFHQNPFIVKIETILFNIVVLFLQKVCSRVREVNFSATFV